jgi:hypothetical protein
MGDVFNMCEYESADEHKAHQLQDDDPYLSDAEALEKAKKIRRDKNWTEVWVD